MLGEPYLPDLIVVKKSCHSMSSFSAGSICIKCEIDSFETVKVRSFQRTITSSHGSRLDRNHRIPWAQNLTKAESVIFSLRYGDELTRTCCKLVLAEQASFGYLTLGIEILLIQQPNLVCSVRITEAYRNRFTFFVDLCLYVV